MIESLRYLINITKMCLRASYVEGKQTSCALYYILTLGLIYPPGNLPMGICLLNHNLSVVYDNLPTSNYLPIIYTPGNLPTR